MLYSVIVTFVVELITLEFGSEKIVVFSFESDQPLGVKLGGPYPLVMKPQSISQGIWPHKLPWSCNQWLPEWSCDHWLSEKPISKTTFTWLHFLSYHLPLRSSRASLCGLKTQEAKEQMWVEGSDTFLDLLCVRPCPRHFWYVSLFHPLQQFCKWTRYPSTKWVW